MQKQGKVSGHEVKNPAVWRKTGQPDTGKGSLGRNAFQNYQETNTVQGLGERPSPDHHAEKAFIQAQTASSRQEPKQITAKNGKQKKEGTHGKIANDPLGLGFQGKGNKKIDLSRGSAGNEEGGLYSGHLPLIKDMSTIEGRDKYTKQSRNERKLENIHEDFQANNGVLDAQHKEDDQQNVRNFDAFPELVAAEKSNAESSTKDNGLRKDYTRFPKMINENHEKMLQDVTEHAQKKKRLGIIGIPEDDVMPDSRLVPFEIVDASQQQNSIYTGFQRMQEGVLKNQTIHEETRQAASGNEAQPKREKTAKDPKMRLKEEIKQMRFRRSSIFRGISPQLSLSQKTLNTEMYGMQKLHFTSNFTFSFFDMPSNYQEQNEFIRSSVNAIGRRKARPKFSRPVPKAQKNKTLKTDL